MLILFKVSPATKKLSYLRKQRQLLLPATSWFFHPAASSTPQPCFYAELRNHESYPEKERGPDELGDTGYKEFFIVSCFLPQNRIQVRKKQTGRIYFWILHTHTVNRNYVASNCIHFLLLSLLWQWFCWNRLISVCYVNTTLVEISNCLHRKKCKNTLATSRRKFKLSVPLVCAIFLFF